MPITAFRKLSTKRSVHRFVKFAQPAELQFCLKVLNNVFKAITDMLLIVITFIISALICLRKSVSILLEKPEAGVHHRRVVQNVSILPDLV